jgi:hypothetical protein
MKLMEIRNALLNQRRDGRKQEIQKRTTRSGDHQAGEDDEEREKTPFLLLKETSDEMENNRDDLLSFMNHLKERDGDFQEGICIKLGNSQGAKDERHVQNFRFKGLTFGGDGFSLLN